MTTLLTDACPVPTTAVCVHCGLPITEHRGPERAGVPYPDAIEGALLCPGWESTPTSWAGQMFQPVPGTDQCPGADTCTACDTYICADHTNPVDCADYGQHCTEECREACRWCQAAYAEDMAEDRAIKMWKGLLP